MTDKKIDMSVFVGKDFDCEEQVICTNPEIQQEWRPVVLEIQEHLDIYNDPRIRPRLNKPQVLDDYSWLPEGLVLFVRFYMKIANIGTWDKMNIHRLLGLVEKPSIYISHVAIVGLHPDYTEQAKEWDYPIIKI